MEKIVPVVQGDAHKAEIKLPSKHNRLNECCFDVGPALKQRWFNVSCLLVMYTSL